jgi:hypothetical protein
MSQSSSQKEAARAPNLFAAFAPLRVARAEPARAEPPRPAAREDLAPASPAQARTVEGESGIDPGDPEGFRFE